MKKTVQVVVIKDPEGNIWSTPKGKSSWGSVGAAKNAWCYHINPRTSNLWDRDAVGWSVEVLQEYELVRVK